MLMQMHGKKGLNGDGRLLRWFLVPLLPKPQYTLLQQSHFTKLAEEPEKLIKQMAMELDTRLYEVGEYLEQDYYRQLDELSVNTP